MAALDSLISFFRTHQGRLQGFRWKDGADAAKPVVVDITCKDAEDFRAQGGGTRRVNGAPLSFLRDARSALHGLRRLCVESSRGGEEVVKLAAYRRAVVVEAELELLLEEAKAAATPRCAFPPDWSEKPSE